MARPLRIQYPGAIYHVTARGNARQGIYAEDRDRERFLEYVASAVETCEVRLYLFCLMSNHFHLVVETPQANLSRFMQLVQTSYSHFHNRRHSRVGHLFQGRYTARVVHADDYLQALSRYVHLNPVFVANLRRKTVEERVQALRAYRWSSLPGYCRASRHLSFVEYEAVLSCFGNAERRRRRAYREYVESGIAHRDQDLIAMMKKPWPAIGADKFRAWVMDLHDRLSKDRTCKEDISFPKTVESLSAEEVMHRVAKALGVDVPDLTRRRRGTPVRGVAARMLCRYAGLTQRDAARVLGLGTGTAVGWQLRTLCQRTKRDRRLRRQVEQLERLLQETRRQGPAD
jgi:REP element-mobilizing transposase RayT